MGVKKTALILAILSISILAYSIDTRVCAIGVTGVINLAGYAPYGPVYDSGRDEIFVNSYGPTSVISDKTNQVVATIDTNGGAVSGMAYDSAKNEIFQSIVYTGSSVSSSVNVISDSTNSVVATIPMGSYAGSMAYDSGRGEIFVAHADYQLPNVNNSIWVISDVDNTVVAKIPIEHAPSDLAYDSGKGEIFITNNGGWGGNSVTVISDNNNTIVANIIVGTAPQCLAYDSAKGEIFVTNNGDNTVSVISDSTNTVVATVNVGYYPLGIAYDSGKGEIYVANPSTLHGGNSTSVISDANNTVITTIPNIAYPYWIAYDSGKGELFVTNTLSDIADQIFTHTITILSDSVALAAPSAFASPTTISQGETSILTSNLTTGAAPFTYQWLSQAPNETDFSPICNVTSPNYNFTTTASTASGNWTFILQVTDATGTTVNSTVVQVTVNSPASTVGIAVNGFDSKVLVVIAVLIVFAAVVSLVLVLRKVGKHRVDRSK